MKAAVLREFGKPLQLEEVETPRPGPDEVLVQVMACGTDGTDLKLMDGFGYVPELPFIMGHEPAGIVAEEGTLATTNALLVEKAVRIAREVGREIASPEEAREIIGLSKMS